MGIAIIEEMIDHIIVQDEDVYDGRSLKLPS
jgi:hypothetical protein